MLIAPGVDPASVLSRALVWCALVCCALVALSFALFAVDRASHASKSQVKAVAAGSVPTGGGTVTPTRHGQPRRFIDGAASKLTSPFRSLISSSSQWGVEIGSTLLALAVYGLGFGFLARYARII
jgi:hypothetical protein